MGGVTVVCVQKAEVWRGGKLHAIVSGRGGRVDIIVESTDDDIVVLAQHLLQGRQIVRFTVVRNDNPLDVFKTDGLR